MLEFGSWSGVMKRIKIRIQGSTRIGFDLDQDYNLEFELDAVWVVLRLHFGITFRMRRF